MCRQGRQPVVRFFERYALCSSRTSQRRKSVVNAPPVKNFVCAPPSETPGIAYSDSIISAMKSTFETLVGPEEFHVQIARDRQVEHHFDRMLLLCHRDVASDLADILLEFARIRSPTG